MNTTNTTFIFWLNYVAVALNINAIVFNFLNHRNTHWSNIVAFSLSFLVVAIYQRYLSFFSRNIVSVLTSAIITTLALIMTHLATSPLYKLSACVLSMFGFLSIGLYMGRVIENTLWFKNYKNKNMQLIEAENNGAAPDSKDFE